MPLPPGSDPWNPPELGGVVDAPDKPFWGGKAYRTPSGFLLPPWAVITWSPMVENTDPATSGQYNKRLWQPGDPVSNPERIPPAFPSNLPPLPPGQPWEQSQPNQQTPTGAPSYQTSGNAKAQDLPQQTLDNANSGLQPLKQSVASNPAGTPPTNRKTIMDEVRRQLSGMFGPPKFFG
jgi:hypothetical protein